MLHANINAVRVIEAELLVMGFSTYGDRIGSLLNAVLCCRNMHCWPFLLLWPWPWPN